MARKALEAKEIAAELESLPGWRYADGALRREFRFPDFAKAFAFMNAAALVAEQMNHHPDWRNVYNKIDVALSTHDAQGITALDFKLAAEMNTLWDSNTGILNK
jgi:4a-hydroxytetrahydrobiopterin dehydratase